MKTIMQTAQHVTIRLTWAEIDRLDTALDSFEHAVSENKSGSYRDVIALVTRFRRMIFRAVAQREMNAHGGEYPG